MIWLLLVIILTVAINALYVAAEFSTVSARRSSIQQLAFSGNKAAIGLLPILEDGVKLDRYVATCQIGITLSSIVLGAFGQASLSLRITPLIEKWGGVSSDTAFGITAVAVLIVLTIFQMILGELVPKSISLQKSTQVALATYVPMRWSMIGFSWFIDVLNGSSIAILRMFGAKQTAHRHIHSPGELEFLIAESRDGGALEPDEHARLKKALALSTRQASEIMVPRTKVIAIDLDDSNDEIFQIVANSPYTRFPVYKGSTDNVIGMLHAKDFVTHYMRDTSLPPLKDMLRPLPAIPATLRADKLLTLMKKRKAQQAIVIDEYGGVDGIVTLEDVLGEMMGSVGDEFKLSVADAERLPDGRVRLSGDLRLDEAEPWIGILWQGDAYTVSGRVTEALGNMPIAGATVEIDGVEVEVEHVEKNVVVSVLVRPRVETEENINA